MPESHSPAVLTSSSLTEAKPKHLSIFSLQLSSTALLLFWRGCFITSQISELCCLDLCISQWLQEDLRYFPGLLRKSLNFSYGCFYVSDGLEYFSVCSGFSFFPLTASELLMGPHPERSLTLQAGRQGGERLLLQRADQTLSFSLWGSSHTRLLRSTITKLMA